jgi:integrase
MRHGEALSLRWSEVDLVGAKDQSRANGNIGSCYYPRKRKTVRARSRGRWQRGTFCRRLRTSNRTIPIPLALVSILREWKLQCPKGKADLVFPALDGTAMHRSRTLRGVLLPTLRKGKLRQVDV